MADAKPGEISVYVPAQVSEKCLRQQGEKLSAAFPKLKPEWFIVLADRLKELEFSDERFTAAVNEVIKTCEFPEPTIARVVSFDKKIELLGYEGYCEKAAAGLGKYYKLVRKGGEKPALWANVEDIERYHLTALEPTPTTAANDALQHEPTTDEQPASKETVERVKREMAELTMKAKTRLSKEEFEANRKRAQEVLARELTK